LHGQFAHTLQHVVHFVERAFGGLHEGNAVRGIVAGAVKAVYLEAELIGDGKAGGVILGGIDAEARGQTLHGGGEAAVRAAHTQMGFKSGDIMADYHGEIPPL